MNARADLVARASARKGTLVPPDRAKGVICAPEELKFPCKLEACATSRAVSTHSD